MNKSDIFWAFVGVVLICLFAYGTYEAFVLFIQKLKELNPNVAASIVGAMATIIGGVLVVVITQSQSKKRQAEESHRERKVEIYKKHLDLMSKMVAGANSEIPVKAPTEKELIKYMLGFKTDIILWASPKLLRLS